MPQHRQEWWAYQDGDYWSVYRNGRIIAHNVRSEGDIKRLVRKRDGTGVRCMLEEQDKTRRPIIC